MRTVLCSLFLAAAVVAQAPSYTHCVSNEQLRHYQTVSDPQLSPDGARVVYVQHEATADGAGSHLWLAAAAAGAAPRQLTFSPASDHQGESAPQWMPDGSAVLFLAKRGDTRQVFRLPLSGGEAAPIAIKIKAGDLNVGAFAISPNGQWLAVHAPAPQTAQEKQDAKDKKDARIVDEDPHPQQVWLYSFATGKAVAATTPDRNASGMAWSPDSSELAVITAPPGGDDDLGPRNQLEIVSVADPSQIRMIAGAPATVSAVAFSPSGEDLALLAQNPHDTPPGISALFLLPAAGGTAKDLSDTVDYEIAGRSLTWTPDDSAIYVGAQRQTEGGMVRFPVAGGAPQWLSPASPMATAFATNLRQTGWVFLAQATDRMPQVEFAASLDATAATPLSHANPAWSSTGWSAGTEVSWQAPDGMTIHGLYFDPNGTGCAGASTPDGGKTPLILVAHGGPTGSFVQTFSPLVQWFAAQGWAVLEPNPRGSTGYGWQFAAANKNDLGGKDYQDEMAGLDWALAHHPIDAHRLGLYGYSYGGEMAGFIEGKTDRFAAIVAGAPVIDQYSEYGTESGSWYDRWFFGRPWVQAQDAWRQSPLAYAAHAKTPLLLLQGQADTTDPLGQSEEMYRALRQMDVPVRLMTFPRENHGPLSGGIGGSPSPEPWHGFEARTQILAWYREHFGEK